MSLQESSSTPCKYYKVGHCKFGDSCHFIHPPNCIIPQCPKLSCPNRHPRQCKYYSKFGSCKYSENCSFSHSNAPSPCPSTQSPSAYEDLLQEIQTLKLSIVSLTQRLDESDSLLSTLQQQLLKNNIEQQQPSPKILPSVALTPAAPQTSIPTPLSTPVTYCPKDKHPNPFSYPSVTPAKDKQPFCCSQCNYQCSLESGLKRHITMKHEPSPPITFSFPKISSPPIVPILPKVPCTQHDNNLFCVFCVC